MTFPLKVAPSYGAIWTPRNIWLRDDHVVEILLLNNFFQIVDMCLSCEDIARQSCALVRRWRVFASFLRPVFPASRVQHISDLHSKLDLLPMYKIYVK